jgi:RNA polymerase sigma-70 factor (ECF subfamily)
MQLRTPKNLKTTEFNPDSMQLEEEMHLNGVLLKEENLQKLERCLQTLSNEQKQAVELFYLQNKCYKEIAAVTGIEWNKVRSFIQNGRRNLKICMEEKSEVRSQRSEV